MPPKTNGRRRRSKVSSELSGRPSRISTPRNDNNSTLPPASQDNTEPLKQDEIETTPLDQLLLRRRPLQLATDLSESLGVLRSRLATLEIECTDCDGLTVNTAMLRRTQDRRERLKVEIAQTKKTIQRLRVMALIVDRVVDLRNTVFTETRASLEAEAKMLREKIDFNNELIREKYVSRVNLLHRYWLWRTLQELGDVMVGRTFHEELARGPRYRSIGLQNCILSDTLEQQLEWLRSFASREEFFREHIRRLERLVEELTDINEALEESLVCRVCGLLFECPVIFWPCGHSFCLVCFDSLSIAPSLFRCPTCGSIDSEGYLHNILVSESVAKWMFKEAGYGDIHGSIALVRLHLSKFKKEVFAERIATIRARLTIERDREMRPENETEMNIVFRAF